jgi:puromycin-sensitive aminopeptidase
MCMSIFRLTLRFATWIQFLAVDHVYPDYDIWTQFLADNLDKCMISDALHNSHPIEMSIRKPTEIDEIFDDITYEKGSNITSMFVVHTKDTCHLY